MFMMEIRTPESAAGITPEQMETRFMKLLDNVPDEQNSTDQDEQGAGI